jgi:magnesium chelatase accessory protein
MSSATASTLPPARIPADWPHRAHSRSITAGGLDWHVQCLGHGPTLLLLHGSGGSAHSWAPMLPALAAHATVVAPDLPGHGWTRGTGHQQLGLPEVARALQALLQALALPAPCMVVGHSAGAALALRWALSQAQRPPQALLGFNPSLVAPPAVYTRLLGPLVTPVITSSPVAALVSGWGIRAGLVRRLLDSTGSRLEREQQARYETLFSLPEHVRGTLGFMAAADLDSLMAQASPLAPRCHFVLGETDAWVPAAPLRRLIARALPEAGVEAWAGGHLLHEVEPERATATVLGRLATVSHPHDTPI